MTVRKQDGSPADLLAILLSVSVSLMLMAMYSTVRMYFLAGEFVVLSSHEECVASKWRSQWCQAHYSVRIPEGTVLDFVPFRDEFNSGVLHDGATFMKQSKGFYYAVNGTHERWPLLSRQIALFLAGCLGLALFVAWSGPRHLSRKPRTAKTPRASDEPNIWVILSPRLKRRRPRHRTGQRHSP